MMYGSETLWNLHLVEATAPAAAVAPSVATKARGRVGQGRECQGGGGARGGGFGRRGGGTRRGWRGSGGAWRAHTQAGRGDKEGVAGQRRSVAIGEMGNFHELLRRRDSEG